MTLTIDEFIRRFLIHVLPKRFHRIRRFQVIQKSSTNYFSSSFIRWALDQDIKTERHHGVDSIMTGRRTFLAALTCIVLASVRATIR
jgi:hypothetical protein